MMIEILIYCHQCHHIINAIMPQAASCLLSVESTRPRVEVEVMKSVMWHAIMVSDRDSICASSALTREPEPGRSLRCQWSSRVARAKFLSYD